MSQGISCKCPEAAKPVAERNWGVSQLNQRCSAFDGYRAMWSPYSAVHCMSCRATWRTKALFVGHLRLLEFRDGDYRYKVKNSS